MSTTSAPRFKTDMDRGLLVERAVPFLIGPGTDEVNFGSDKSPIAICLGCYKKLDPEHFQQCGKCRLPVCGPACSQAYFHRAYECHLAPYPARVTRETMTQPVFYASITLTRAFVLKTVAPESWNKIMSELLEAKRFQSLMVEERGEKVNQTIHDSFCNREDPLGNNGIAIYSVLHLHGLAFSGPENISCTGFYWNVRTHIHSCIPNAGYFQRFTDDEMILSLELITLCDTVKRQPITVSYMDDTLYLSTGIRRRRLLAHFNISCDCRRCTDPTETSSYFSGRVCQTPQLQHSWATHVNWHQLPNLPGVPGPGGPLTFHCNGCGRWEEDEYDERYDAAIYEYVDTELGMLDNYVEQKEHMDKMRNHVNQIVHPGHSVVFKLDLIWMKNLYDWMLMVESEDERKAYAEQIMEYAVKCVGAHNKLMRDRLDPTRGIILFYLAQALRWKNHPDLRPISDDIILPRVYKEALKIFQTFPPASEQMSTMRQTLENQLCGTQSVEWQWVNDLVLPKEPLYSELEAIRQQLREEREREREFNEKNPRPPVKHLPTHKRAAKAKAQTRNICFKCCGCFHKLMRKKLETLVISVQGSQLGKKATKSKHTPSVKVKKR